MQHLLNLAAPQQKENRQDLEGLEAVLAPGSTSNPLLNKRPLTTPLIEQPTPRGQAWVSLGVQIKWDEERVIRARLLLRLGARKLSKHRAEPHRSLCKASNGAKPPSSTPPRAKPLHQHPNLSPRLSQLQALGTHGSRKGDESPPQLLTTYCLLTLQGLT